MWLVVVVVVVVGANAIEEQRRFVWEDIEDEIFEVVDVEVYAQDEGRGFVDGVVVDILCGIGLLSPESWWRWWWW